MKYRCYCTCHTRHGETRPEPAFVSIDPSLKGQVETALACETCFRLHRSVFLSVKFVTHARGTSHDDSN